MDTLREYYVNGLNAKTHRLCPYGKGWEPCNTCSKKCGQYDSRQTHEIMRDYTFSLIIENCNADGYVSEKIYDAFVAESIPIYFGNNNERIGISSDMYIDLHQYSSPELLIAYIDSLTDEQIHAYKMAIRTKRESVLRKASGATLVQLMDSILEH